MPERSEFPPFFSKSRRSKSILGGNRTAWDVVIPRSHAVSAGDVIDVERADGGVRWIRLTVEHEYGTDALTAVKQRWSFDNVADKELNEVLAGLTEESEARSRAGRHAVVRESVAAVLATPTAAARHEPAHAADTATEVAQAETTAAQRAARLDELTALAKDYFDNEPNASDVGRRKPVVDVNLPVEDTVAPPAEPVKAGSSTVASAQPQVVDLEKYAGPSPGRVGGYAIGVASGLWMLRALSRRAR